jgi:hypothetical protein
MIKRLASIVVIGALLVQLSCNFAVKHPAVTAGIVAGTTALVTCELASEDHKNCFMAGGAVGVGLALIAAVALWLGSEDEPAPTTSSEPPPKVDWDKIPDTTPKEPTKAPPQTTPPPDAGVPADAPMPPPPPPSDAGAPASDAAP